MSRPVRIITPTGHLGTTPLEKASFERGCAASPDFIVADSGSADIGPYPLGADRAASDEVWQRHDIEAMLLAARRLGIPLIIGSASDTGTDRGVDQYVRLVREIAAEHGLAPFRLAAIYSEIPVDDIRRRLKDGAAIRGLNGRPDCDDATLDRTDRIVAVMGAEPIRDALTVGAEVVIAGRSSDCAIFAAPLLNAGHSAADAFFCGKAMECASFCGEPFMGKETILGRVDGTGVSVRAMHPDQRCTPASVASHAMYERLNPYRELVPGGYLDMTHCRYEQVDEKTTRVTGQTFVPSPTTWIKLEGSGKVAERALFIVGVRDPYTIANLDRAIGWAKGKLTERFGPIGTGYDVFYHVYGRDAVMGAMEPTPAQTPLEVGIVVEVVCDDAARAETICHIAGKNLFYARLPDVKGTAGTAAIMSDEVLHARPAYEWTLNHVVEVADPRELFRTRLETGPGRGGDAVVKLVELASTIRSKNAGVDHITFDVICRDRANFERVRDSRALNREAVARLFGIDRDRVTDFVVFEPANAIKFTIRRLRPSGGMGESDLFGSQQYAPLFDVEIP